MADYSIPNRLPPLIPVWVKVVCVLIYVSLCLWALYAFGAHQFKQGETTERSAWLQRDNDALRKANKRIAELEEEARTAERNHQLAMSAASANYQKELQNVEANKDRTIADLRNGTVRLRVQLAAASMGAVTGETGASGSSACRCNGETTGYLSVSTSEFLVGLASEADAVVQQLSACQAVIEADRETQGETTE